METKNQEESFEIQFKFEDETVDYKNNDNKSTNF